MKLEEIQQLWSKDAQINELQLGSEALRSSQLHCDYYKIFISERLTLKRMQHEYKELRNLRHDFYTGKIDDETLAERGWEDEFRAFNIKVLKGDVDRYLQGDKVLNDYSLKVAYQEEKVDFLSSILDTIKYRTNAIKAAIDWARFTAGG